MLLTKLKLLSASFVPPFNRRLYLKQNNYHKAKILSWQLWLNEHQTPTTCNIRITSTPSIFDCDLCLRLVCTSVCNPHFELLVKCFHEEHFTQLRHTCNILPRKEHAYLFLVNRKVNLTLWQGKCVFVLIKVFQYNQNLSLFSFGVGFQATGLGTPKRAMLEFWPNSITREVRIRQAQALFGS